MTDIVESKRVLYTPSRFAKESLIFLQEVGTSKTITKHTNSRPYMSSYLFFIVLDGEGELRYQNLDHKLKKGSCAFIDCHHPYSNTSGNWNIAWIHFNGNKLNDIYNKYIDRNGSVVFTSDNFQQYHELIKEIYRIASSDDYIKDMAIFHKLSELLFMLMEETVYQEDENRNNKYDIDQIKNYIDNNYIKDISLDDLSELFYINKYYLTRIFKEKYGSTINTYISSKRITKAKELLRFSSSSIADIALACGIKDPNYFSRLFKKIEGISPKDYKKMW